MEAESVLQAGGGAQTGATRWGDYSALRIDPSDDCTFWYTNEYYPVSSSVGWATAIGSFKLSNCTQTPDFSITETASPLTFTAGTGGTSNGTVTVTSLNGLSVPVALTTGGACNGASGITCSTSPTSVTPPVNGSAPSNLTIGVPAATIAGSYPITVTGTTTTPALTHSTTMTVVVSPPAANFTVSASPAPPAYLTVKRKSSGSYAVKITVSNGISSSVTLSVSGLPSRTSASFSPNPVTTSTTSGSSTLTIKPGPSAPVGTFTLMITGSNGGFTSQPFAVTLVIK